MLAQSAAAIVFRRAAGFAAAELLGKGHRSGAPTKRSSKLSCGGAGHTDSKRISFGPRSDDGGVITLPFVCWLIDVEADVLGQRSLLLLTPGSPGYQQRRPSI